MPPTARYRYHRPYTKGGLYFLTAVTHQRQRILLDEPLSRPHPG